MKLVKDNANVFAFGAGWSLLVVGVAHQMSWQAACIVAGLVLMVLVLADAAIKIAFRLRERGRK